MKSIGKKALRATGLLLFLVMGFTRPVRSEVTLFTDQSAFIAATGAGPVLFPSWDQIALDSLSFARITSSNGILIPPSPIGIINTVEVSAPNSPPTSLKGMGGWTLAYDVPPLTFASPTSPPITPGILVASGEDDYLLTFDTPVFAVGLGLVTNALAKETVTLRNEAEEILFQDTLDSLTEPNSVVFLGFVSAVPIKSLFLNTEGGKTQDEALFLILTAEVTDTSCPFFEFFVYDPLQDLLRWSIDLSGGLTRAQVSLTDPQGKQMVVHPSGVLFTPEPPGQWQLLWEGFDGEGKYCGGGVVPARVPPRNCPLLEFFFYDARFNELKWSVRTRGAENEWVRVVKPNGAIAETSFSGRIENPRGGTWKIELGVLGNGCSQSEEVFVPNPPAAP